MAITLGVDIGGTFTDFVWAEDGALRVFKLPTAPAQEEGFLAGLERLPMGKIRRIVHGTTVATNALLEGKWAATALITTAGFGDVLEIGRQNRPSLYDLFCDRPPPLVPREWRLEVPERLDARGRVIRPLDEEAVRELAAKIKAGGIQAVAVVFLFSFLNPAHERRVEKILREEGVEATITLSSEVLPEFREYERTSTTVMTAALRPVVEGYLSRLSGALASRGIAAPILVMQPSGGVAGGPRRGIPRPHHPEHHGGGPGAGLSSAGGAYELREGSGGKGRYRGGMGIRRDIRVLGHRAVVSLLADRRARGPWGLEGGAPGAPGEDFLIIDGEEKRIPAKGTVEVPPDGIISIRTPGGGYGAP